MGWGYQLKGNGNFNIRFKGFQYYKNKCEQTNININILIKRCEIIANETILKTRWVDTEIQKNMLAATA